jgi:hypothetical protein
MADDKDTPTGDEVPPFAGSPTPDVDPNDPRHAPAPEPAPAQEEE